MAGSRVRFEIGVLGPLRIQLDGKRIDLRPAQRRLLAILLLDPGRELERDTLQDRMWGDAPPSTAPSALQVHLSGLRRSLPGVLVSAGATYRVDLRDVRLDRHRFEGLAARAVADAAAGRWERALRSGERATSMWRGTPYHEVRDDEPAAGAIARLAAMHDELAVLRVRGHAALGRAERAVTDLRELVQRDPLREPLWEELMRMLHAAGRRSEALTAFQKLRHVLASELGVEPSRRLQALEEQIVRDDEMLVRPALPEPRGALPVTHTSFVGREDDVAELARQVTLHRLVTVVGGPGIGKTRLAVEAGHAVRHERPDGAWFADLSTVRTTEELIAAIAGTLGLRSHGLTLTVLADRIRPRDALVILDNCEHLRKPCGELLQLVLAAPGPVRILATSRQALGLTSEVAWPVPPLGTPDVGDADARTLLRAPSVRLFLDRARAVDRTYRLSDGSAPAVGALCRSTDGIPLAIELAAAWAPALGPREIEEMLRGDETPPAAERSREDRARHRSLGTAVGWSVALLAPGDRELFEAASVFRGAFSLDDTVSVCARVGERRRTAATIGRLVDASLIVADRHADGSVTYRTLVPLRELAHDRLERSVAWPGIRFRFVTHFLGRARGTPDDPFRAVTDLDRVDADIDNLREAFALGLADGRADEVARALVALDGYFMNRYLAREQRTWVDRVLPAVTDPATRAHLLLSDALAAQATNALDEAERRFEDALRAFRSLGDDAGAARCLLALAGLHANRGRWADGEAAAREGQRLAANLHSPSSRGIAAYYLGTNLAYSGQVTEGIAELAVAADRFTESGEHGRVAQALSTIGYLAMLDGQRERATEAARASVAEARRSGSDVRLVRALSAVAVVEARWGDANAARRGLAEVHDRLRAQANEDLFEFLLPAGILLARLQAWELVTRLVATTEAAIAASGQGFPEPWRATTHGWLEAARVANPSRTAAGSPVAGAADIADVRAAVRRALDEPPTPDPGRTAATGRAGARRPGQGPRSPRAAPRAHRPGTR